MRGHVQTSSHGGHHEPYSPVQNAMCKRWDTPDFSLSHAAPETPLWACARVAKAAHRLEACLQRSTSEAGLADDEVRHGTGWQQHPTLSLRATWFLERETHRGKKMDARPHAAADSPRHRADLTRS